jgi:hypothetical protein
MVVAMATDLSCLFFTYNNANLTASLAVLSQGKPYSTPCCQQLITKEVTNTGPQTVP